MGCTVPTGVVAAGVAGGVMLVVAAGVTAGLGCTVAPGKLPDSMAAALQSVGIGMKRCGLKLKSHVE